MDVGSLELERLVRAAVCREVRTSPLPCPCLQSMRHQGMGRVAARNGILFKKQREKLLCGRCPQNCQMKTLSLYKSLRIPKPQEIAPGTSHVCRRLIDFSLLKGNDWPRSASQELLQLAAGDIGHFRGKRLMLEFAFSWDQRALTSRAIRNFDSQAFLSTD